MRKERRQDSMPTCAHGAWIWQVLKMHTLLRMRTKPGSIVVDSLLQLTVALFPDHSSTTATPASLLFASPRESFPSSQNRSNTLILVPSFLNLFSCLLMGSDYKQHHSLSSRSLAGLLPAFLFVPNSNIYYFCLHMPVRLSIITPEDAKGKACSLLSNLEVSIVKSYFYKPLQLAPGQHCLSC